MQPKLTKKIITSAVKEEKDGRYFAFIFFLLHSTDESSPSCLHYLSAVFWFLSLVRHSFVSPKTLLLCFLTFFFNSSLLFYSTSDVCFMCFWNIFTFGGAF